LICIVPIYTLNFEDIFEQERESDSESQLYKPLKMPTYSDVKDMDKDEMEQNDAENSKEDDAEETIVAGSQ